MAGSFSIFPDDGTIRKSQIWEPEEIHRIIWPRYTVTTIRINEFGDLLHCDAEATNQPNTASFQFAGYRSQINCITLITGRMEENGFVPPTFKLEEIIDRVKFTPGAGSHYGIASLREKSADSLEIWNRLPMRERRLIQRQVLRGSVPSIAAATLLCTEYIRQYVDDCTPLSHTTSASIDTRAGRTEQDHFDDVDHRWIGYTGD